MKAIRLCMDLQNTNKVKDAKASELSSSSSSVRTNDDMDIDTSSASSKTSDKNRGPDKKEFLRKNRRHYSDVNPGNISKMFSVQGLTLDKSLSQSTSSQSSITSSAPSSKEPASERDIHPELSLPSQLDLATSTKGKYDQYSWSRDNANNIPFGRFVEGSDSHVTSASALADQASKAGSDKEEEERKRRAKSPSAKIKERSRAKSPKLHSPPPGESKFTFHPTTREDDKMSVSSEDMSYMDDADVCTIQTLIPPLF